jgi:hypothetical protein
VLPGVTDRLAELAPVLQLYVDAPLPVITACCPAQIVGELTVTVGFPKTVIVAVDDLLHPLAFTPVTVYVVVTVGVAVIVVVFAPNRLMHRLQLTFPVVLYKQ